MKRFIVTFAFFVFTYLAGFAQSYADFLKSKRDEFVQSTGKFLTIKGIELKPEMNVNDMYNMLLRKGFVESEISKEFNKITGGYELKGTFYGVLNCSVVLYPIATDKNILGMVSISFPNQKSFKALKRDYDNLKISLGDKYSLINSIEKFDDDYIKEMTSDYLKLRAIKNDEATFQSVFYLSANDVSVILLGQVFLRIAYADKEYQDNYYVSLVYYTSDYVMEQFASGNNDL